MNKEVVAVSGGASRPQTAGAKSRREQEGEALPVKQMVFSEAMAPITPNPVKKKAVKETPHILH